MSTSDSVEGKVTGGILIVSGLDASKFWNGVAGAAERAGVIVKKSGEFRKCREAQQCREGGTLTAFGSVAGSIADDD